MSQGEDGEEKEEWIKIGHKEVGGDDTVVQVCFNRCLHVEKHYIDTFQIDIVYCMPINCNKTVAKIRF